MFHSFSTEWHPAPNTLNASLESLIIHARNIRDFFNSTGRENDVLAIDFLGRNLRIRMPYIRKNKKRLDRRIAHLSYSRSRMSPKWDVAKIISEMNDSINRFIKKLKVQHPSIDKDVFNAFIHLSDFYNHSLRNPFESLPREEQKILLNICDTIMVGHTPIVP